MCPKPAKIPPIIAVDAKMRGCENGQGCLLFNPSDTLRIKLGHLQSSIEYLASRISIKSEHSQKQKSKVLKKF